MNSFKFLIVVPYYNRPNMFREGLKTLLSMSYDNWEVAIIDDGSDEDKKASSVIKDVFGELTPLSQKVKLYETKDTLENKLRRGSIHSTFMNLAIKESDADYALMISDDDGLYEYYLEDLNEYYNQHPEVNYSFSHIIPYDPMEELPSEETFLARKKEIGDTGKWRNFNSDSWINVNHITDCPPVDVLDATQVSWNIKEGAKHGCTFDESNMINCDRDIFSKFYQNFGVCPYNKTVGPYKAFHGNQLGVRVRADSNLYEVVDKDE